MAELRKENKEIKIQLETLKKEEASMKEKETQIKALQLAFVNVQQVWRHEYVLAGIKTWIFISMYKDMNVYKQVEKHVQISINTWICKQV